jgi:hypothetical protein
VAWQNVVGRLPISWQRLSGPEHKRVAKVVRGSLLSCIAVGEGLYFYQQGRKRTLMSSDPIQNRRARHTPAHHPTATVCASILHPSPRRVITTSNTGPSSSATVELRRSRIRRQTQLPTNKRRRSDEDLHTEATISQREEATFWDITMATAEAATKTVSSDVAMDLPLLHTDVGEIGDDDANTGTVAADN